MPNMTETEVFDRFAQVVAKSLRVDVSQVSRDVHLNDLGAESLDLIEITMETETQFHIFLPDDTSQAVSPVFLDVEYKISPVGSKATLST